MDVVHDVKKDTCKCARPGFTPLEDRIHYGAWKHCHPALGWVKRQHRGGS